MEAAGFRIQGDLTGVSDLRRQLEVLYSAKKGSIPINRDFGLDWLLLGSPELETQSLFTVDVMAQTDKYVSAVRVSGVSFEGDHVSGKIIPVIHVERRQ